MRGTTLTTRSSWSALLALSSVRFMCCYLAGLGMRRGPKDASNTDLGHYLPLVATNRLRDTGDCPDKALSLSAIPFVDWGHYVEDMG